jgi:predicted RNA-binding Zn-ribbon protein involved in translation (DUF1610 family)
MSTAPTEAQHQKHENEAGGFSAYMYFVDLIRYGEKVGEAEVEFCSTCGLHVVTRCSHTQNEGDAQGTTLTCKACGADVT